MRERLRANAEDEFELKNGVRVAVKRYLW
jgi:hypothetical protein